MDFIDYNQSGGFPLSAQILAAAQDAYKNFNAYGQLAGQLAIITGCNDINVNEVSDGFVSINGELLPFKSSTKSEFVVIVESSDIRGFEDGSAKPVIYKRYVTFGNAATQYSWSDFRRPLTLFQLEDRLKIVEKAVPIGLVAIWGLPADGIPLGWVPHTPLDGLVPAGRKDGDPNFGAMDAVIGTPQVTLKASEIPPLSGTVPVAPNPDSPGSNVYGRGGQVGSMTVNINQSGGGSHTNIQPTRIVPFIRFVGFN